MLADGSERRALGGIEEFGRPRRPHKSEIAGSNPASATRSTGMTLSRLVVSSALDLGNGRHEQPVQSHHASLGTTAVSPFLKQRVEVQFLQEAREEDAWVEFVLAQAVHASQLCDRFTVTVASSIRSHLT